MLYAAKDSLPLGFFVVPFCGWYLGSYKVIPKRKVQRSLWVDLQQNPTPVMDIHL